MKSNFGYFLRDIGSRWIPVYKFTAKDKAFQVGTGYSVWSNGKEGPYLKRLTPDTLVRWST